MLSFWQGIMVMTFKEIQTKAFGTASTMTHRLRLCGQVSGRIEKCIDALQLRATKSIPIEGYGRRNGIVPVQNTKVKFSVIKHATVETLLNMPDKVGFMSLALNP